MAHTSVFNEISDLLQATADETATHCVHTIATWLEAKGQPQLAADLIAEFTEATAIAEDGDTGYLTIEDGDAAGRADLDAKGLGPTYGEGE